MRVLSAPWKKVTGASRVDVAELAQVGRLRLLPDIVERQYMLVNGTDVNPTAQAIEFDDARHRWWLQWRACFFIFCSSALCLLALGNAPFSASLADLGLLVLAAFVQGVSSLTFFVCVLMLPLWGLPPKDDAEKFWFLYRAFVEMSGLTTERLFERGKSVSGLQKIATEILVKIATRVINVRGAESVGRTAQTDRFTEAFEIVRQLGYTADRDQEYYFQLARKNQISSITAVSRPEEKKSPKQGNHVVH